MPEGSLSRRDRRSERPPPRFYAGWVDAWLLLPGTDRLLVSLRATLLGLSLIVGLAASGQSWLVAPWLAMVALAAGMSYLATRVPDRPALSLLEALLAVLISTSVPPIGPLTIYLLAPVLSAGLRGGYWWALGTAATPVVLGAVLLLSQPRYSDIASDSVTSLVQWGVLAAALGVMGVWAKGEQPAPRNPSERTYADAVRLLAQLEPLSRQLPRGLEVGTVALDALRDLAAALSAERGLMLVQNSEGDLTPVAGLPDAHSEWLPLGSGDAADRLLDQPDIAWLHLDDETLMLPLRVEGETVGLAVLRGEGIIEIPAGLASDALQAAVSLRAALLFDSIRFAAANEERDRIAREIHDGIAQDVAYLGYVVDEIVVTATDEETRDLAESVRSQITRVVGEIRASVFDLRQPPPSSSTLGSALSDYAHRQLNDTDIHVHVVLDESPQRLLPLVEVELLRIAQEAITNVRRHSKASNVWLECRVVAPHARISIVDDGIGLGARGRNSFGLDIMRERAERISGSLDVAGRDGGGTRVVVEV